MTFGDKLSYLRKQNKMTQDDCANKLGVTRQTISNWELNQTKPDLDQLKGLSKLYEISIDKLVDNNLKEISAEKISNSGSLKKLFFKGIEFMGMNKKLLLMIFTLICIIAIGICVIVNYAINNSITWAYITILSIVFGYLIIISIFAEKHRIVLSLLTLTITILPFLYLLEKAMPVKDWFYSIALPISIVSIIGLWISYLISRFLKINAWYKASILIFMWGSIISPIINHISDGLSYISFQNFANLFSSLVIALICGICGYINTTKKK